MKFCWTTINVSNMQASLKFYQEIVGLPVFRTMKAGPGVEIAFLGQGETKVELIHNAENTNVSFGKDVCMGFEVDSLEEKIGQIRAAGMELEPRIFQPTPTVRFFYISDPDGMKIQFVENSY